MSIQIQENEKNGTVYKNLKFSRVSHPSEHVVVEKVFEEPLTGQNSYGTYYVYTLDVKKIATLDKNAQLNEETDLGEVTMFATDKLHEQLSQYSTGVPLRINKEEVEGKRGSYTTFVVQKVEE